MSLGKPNLDIFAETLLEIAQRDRDVLVVTSDSRGSARLTKFCQTLPAQVIEVGIAEQNLVGVAAGLASAGKKVFAVSPACFLTARALEQIKNDVAYSDLPVKLVGISAGVSYGALGTTHHSLHDLAALQAIHNLDIMIPGDNYETRETILSAVNSPRPIYLRFGKQPMPDLPSTGCEFEVGKARIFLTGSEITLIGTGEPTWRAVEAACILETSGISCGVIGMPSIRPFDEPAVLHAARNSRVVMTVEEHSIHGGLGSRVAALLMEHELSPRFKGIGIPDEPTVAGSQEEIFNHYGITPEKIAETARQILVKESVR